MYDETAFTSWVNKYYEAVANQDSETAAQYLEQTPQMVEALLVGYGNQALAEFADMYDISLVGIEYQPTSTAIEQYSGDLALILLGLAGRMAAELDSGKSLSKALIDNQYQADRIAITHRHILQQAAELDLVDQLFVSQGFRVTKTWVAKVDSHTCGLCLAMNDTTVEFYEEFDYGSDEMFYDGLANAHPHCRCRIVFNLERIS